MALTTYKAQGTGRKASSQLVDLVNGRSAIPIAKSEIEKSLVESLLAVLWRPTSDSMAYAPSQGSE
jgi:hypothetical protein